MPTTMRYECNVVLGYLSNRENMKIDCAVSLTAKIKDADSLSSVLCDSVLNNFLMCVPLDLTGQLYRPQEDS